MKTLVVALAAALALMPLAGNQVLAETPAKTKAAAKPAPAKKAPAKKTAKAQKKQVKAAKKVEVKTPVAQPPLERLTDAEIALAPKVYTGQIQCDLGENVTISADEKNSGFFHVAAGKREYYMHPVVSQTGAVRLEDGRAGAMWLQLGNKSMLLDQKAGQRVADNCAGAVQREFAAHMSERPAVDLLQLDKK